MVRNWITLLQGGREIERPVHIDNRGREFVNVHGKHLNIARLEQDGRLVGRYSFGHPDEEVSKS